MKRKRILAVVAILGMILALGGAALAAEKAPQKVFDMAKGKLAAIGQDPVIIEAVKGENARGKSLDQIKDLDEKWKNTPGLADYMNALMENACGRRLREIQSSNPSMAEIFVMDNQGANVCMTDKTSDYWQGDEAKFQNSFNGGAGKVFVDDVEFDESTQTYVSQVSVPVVEDGKTIGAITFGIDVDKLD